MDSAIIRSNKVIEAEQIKLQNDITKNNKACEIVKGALESVISAALSVPVENDDDSESISSNESSCSKSTTLIANVSLESVKEIHTDDDENTDPESEFATSTPKTIALEDIPGLGKLLHQISQKELKISADTLEHLKVLNNRIDEIQKTSSELQERCSNLNFIIKELSKELNNIKQYIKLDNLLFHKFDLPSQELSSLQFSQFMAQQINYYLPQLSVPVSWHHISDAHPLRTKSRKSNVIIVRFCNRNIRHEIYSKRELLRKPGAAITEHLSEDNLKILYRAKECFGAHNVSTDKCKVVSYVNDKYVKFNSIDDVNEKFELSIAQPHVSTSKDNTYRSPVHKHSRNTNFHRTFYNNNYHGHQVSYLDRRRPPGYSVYNRPYCQN